MFGPVLYISSMKHVLVTGGAGYIGSHTAKALAAQGNNVIVLDNLATGHRDLARWGEFVQGDVRDADCLDRLFRSHEVEAVMHFAAASQVGESVQKPLEYYDNNVGGSTTLLAAMARHGVQRMVFSSTCAVYGPPFDGLLTENHPISPLSPYAHTKRMIEQIMADAAATGSLQYIALRYFNAAGADPEAETGERHTPETHLIPLVLQAALGLRPAITILGEDYPTPDGTCIRDYIHVSDLAQAHMLALGHLVGGGESGAFNLGNGLGASVREVVAAASEVTARDIPMIMGQRRAGDSPRLVGDATRARTVLGWQPQLADIREILATAWRWHQQEAARS